jgi:two-component system response regulator LytT
MTESLTAALRFSIIGCNTKNIESIKDAFREISLKMILVQTYLPSSVFTIPAEDIDSVDFIVADQISIVEMEQAQKTITVPLIVFADDSFDLKPLHNVVFDIIRIPFNFKKIEKIVKKIEIIKKHFEKKSSPYHLNGETHATAARTFLIKKGKEFQLISTDDISMFYTDNKLTFAYNNNGSKFLIQSTLIELESQLSAKHFFRANRQFLINRKYINKIKQLDEGRFEIVIDAVDSLHIDINQQKFSRLKEWIENN